MRGLGKETAAQAGAEAGAAKLRPQAHNEIIALPLWPRLEGSCIGSTEPAPSEEMLEPTTPPQDMWNLRRGRQVQDHWVVSTHPEVLVYVDNNSILSRWEASGCLDVRSLAALKRTGGRALVLCPL